MPGTSQSYDANGWGSSKTGTLSWWHDSRLMQFLNVPPSSATHWVDNQPIYPHVEGSLLKWCANVYTWNHQSYSLMGHLRTTLAHFK